MYPRYEQYQDSGVAWLGDVPSHWKIIKIDVLPSVNGGDSYCG